MGDLKMIKNNMMERIIISLLIFILSTSSVIADTVNAKVARNDYQTYTYEKKVEKDVKEYIIKNKKKLNRFTDKHISYSANRIVRNDTQTIIKSKTIVASRSDDGIFNIYAMNLTSKSNVTVYELNQALKGTRLEGLGRSFILAEEKYGVNAVFLCSVAILESGWGSSKIARNKNNLFGFSAYDSNTSKAKRFRSKSACVDYVARFLSNNYLTHGGRYYNGRTLNAVRKRYTSSTKWDDHVANIMLLLNSRIVRTA
jgi:beta-N-acetylglucosaminidase